MMRLKKRKPATGSRKPEKQFRASSGFSGSRFPVPGYPLTRGFTLLEILAVSVLLAIVALLLLSALGPVGEHLCPGGPVALR